MGNSGTGFSEPVNLVIVEVNAVGEPGLVAKPAAVLEVVERAHPKLGNAKIIFVLSLAKVRVQPHT